MFVGVDLPVEVCGSSLEFAKLESCQGRDDFSISDSKKYSFGFLLKLTWNIKYFNYTYLIERKLH